MLLKRFLFVLIIIIINSFLFSGEIRMGSVPGSVVYQGRIEKNNAPLNGPLHLRFRLYREGSGPNSPDWESDEILTEAKNGIFSATFKPPLNKLSLGTTMYLEIEIEGERLSPKEPIYAVPYALVAKKLEDGASVYFSSITVGPRYLLGVNPPPGASIYTDRICFSGDNSCLAGSNIGTITGGEVASPTTAYIRADTSGHGIGDILFQTSSTAKAIITNDGKFGIGVINPSEKLHLSGNALINGNLTVSNNLNIGSELLVSGILNQGVIRGQNNEQISIGVNNDRIDFVINGSTNVIINQSRLGIGKNPSYSLDVSGSIFSDQLITSTASINFINTNSNLIIQNNLFNVGIGTNVVSEKLTVAGNIKASGDIFASSGVFTNNLRVDGNLKVNNYGSKIELSSTTVYGTLDVKGQFSINNDQIASLASTQTFSGKNTFLSEVNISSNLAILNRVGIGINSNNFAYPENSYLQIGDPTITTLSSLLYLSAGAASDSKINFYKGASKIGYIGTDQNNIAVFTGATNKKKLIINDQYFKIYNSTFIVSTSESDTNPSIYVSSNSYVGINTSNPTHNLTVNGNIRITGSGNMIIFPDGSTLPSGNLGSAGSVSNNNDAIILADADNNGTGKIFLRVKNINSLIIDNTGKIGIGTPTPIDKLHIIGGNIVVGNPNPYTSSGNGDIIVGGNLVIDGMLKQRSQIPVEFASLFVGGDVYLSTNTNAKVGIGTTNPQYKLDVVGNAAFSSGITASSGTFTNTGNYSILTSSGIKMNNGTIQIGGLTGNRLVTTDGSKNLSNTIDSSGLAASITDETGTGNLVFNTNPTFNTGITINGWGNFSQGITASSGTFTATGQYSILSSSGIFVTTGTINLNNSVRIKNSLDPLDSQDLATKYYVDQIGGGGSETGAWVKTGNNLGTNNRLGSTNSKDVIFIRNNTTQFQMTSDGVSFSVPILSNNSITASTLTLTGNAFSVGGSTFVVTAGKVGIGVSSPSSIFHVRGGSVRVENASEQDSVIISGGSGGTNSYAVTITPTTLTGNRILTLANGNTTLVPGTMVPTSRTISTTSPLSGGGDLSSDRTLSIGGLSSIGTPNYVVGVNNNATGWEYKNIVGTANEIDIIHSAGQIQIGIVDPLPVSKGGTGISGAGGIANRVLLTTDGSSWTAGQVNLNSTQITNTLQVGNGGTGSTTYATNQFLWYNGSQITASGYSNSSFASVSHTHSASDITAGTLPITRGGTNNSTFTTNQPVIYDGSKLASFAGFNGSFTVAKSTNTTAGCVQLNYQYGILTSTASVNCP